MRILAVCILSFLLSCTLVNGQEAVSDSVMTEQQNEAFQILIDKGKKSISKIILKKEKSQNKMLRSIQKIETKRNLKNKAFETAIDNLNSTKPKYLKNKFLDSLEAINSFLATEKYYKNDFLKEKELNIYSENLKELNLIKEKIIKQNKIEEYLNKYGKDLTTDKDKYGKWVKRYNKQLQINEQKLKYWERYYKEPDKLEEKALEYLKGVEKFDQLFKNKNTAAFEGIHSQEDIEILKSLGYQTKEQLNNKLQDTYSLDFDKITKSMSASLQKYQEEIHQLTKKGRNVQSSLQNLNNDLNQLNKKPTFKNPMRGVPFLHRWKPGYSFETYRATDIQPAFLKTNFSLSFQQTKNMQLGVAAFFHLGLGKDLRNIRLTYEGLGFKSYCNYNIIFGFAFEGGYEQSWHINNSLIVKEKEDVKSKSLFQNPNNNAYLGIQKTYSLNQKWNAEFLIGYNFMWQMNQLKSPFMLRMGWQKK